jgi:hypothetical protein
VWVAASWVLVLVLVLAQVQVPVLQAGESEPG